MTAARHPLEPLSAEEVQHTVELLKRADKITPTTRFVSVALKEPDKSLVYGFTDSSAEPFIAREAFAVLFDNAANTCYEAVVSLSADAVTAWKAVPGVQPTMTIDEQIECEQTVIKSPEFRAETQGAYRL